MEGMVEGEEAWSPAMELDSGTWDHDTQPNEPPRVPGICCFYIA